MSPLHALLFVLFAVVSLWVVYAWVIAAWQEALRGTVQSLRPALDDPAWAEDTTLIQRVVFPTETPTGA